MAKVITKARFEITKLMKKGLTGAFKQRVGKATIKGAKELIAAGKSPVQSKGRFDAYAVDRAGREIRKKISGLKGGINAIRRKQLRLTAARKASGKYPSGLKNKKPVNLELTGEMLRHFKWESISPTGIKVGILSKAPNRIKEIAEAHNDGTLVDQNVPIRRFIPDKEGERWSLKVRKRINKVYENALFDMIKKSNKRRKK